MLVKYLSAAAVCAMLIPFSGSALADDTAVSITKAGINDGVFTYELSVPESDKDKDIYTVLYSADGRIEATSRNKPEGEFKLATDGSHLIKVFVFEGGTLRPVATTTAAALPGTEEDPDNNRLLFAMDFNNGKIEAKKGKAVMTGTPELTQGLDGSTAAILNKKNMYITLSNEDGSGLLAGKDEITISFRKKTNMGPTWWFFAAPDDTPQTSGQEHYIGILDSGDTLTAERYHNTGFRTDPAVYSYNKGDWQDVTLVIGKERSTLYINGKAVSEKKYGFTLSEMLGDDPVAYVGKANWGVGEWANGAIDDFAIFDFAPDAELGNLSDVKENLTLPTADEATDGYSLSWSSSDDGVITKDGIVTVPRTGMRTAVLTATMKFGRHTLTKDYKVITKADNYSDYTISVSDKKGVDIQKDMYGLFFEDINYAADGGLYAEMVENRSFEAMLSDGKGGTTFDGLYGWSAYPSGGTNGMSVESSGGLNENNTHYLRTSADIRNQAYEGVYMEAGKKYNVSLFAKGSSGGLKAQVYKDGRLVTEAALTEAVTGEWKKYSAAVTMPETVRNADLVIKLTGTGDVDIDMVSCMPDDAVMGVYRRDLAEKLKAIAPGFLRFPGGCIIEGFDLDNRYNWKDSVGAVEERKQNWSRWSCHTNQGIDGGFKHYNQTYGLGFCEYFLLCEYLDCKPVPVVNAGMACEFQSGEVVPLYKADGVTLTDEFKSYIKDALDLIEFANGDENTEWGRLRISMGHKEPFGLDTLGVGNEQWAKEGNQWYERYEAFEKAIHEIYPDMKIISTSGPAADGADFDSAWSWIRSSAKDNDKFTYAVDEHYYMSPGWFLENDGRYDGYDRDVKVFAGEYASQGNTLRNALSEAAFMTGLERNADVVYMASYAPLFARVNFTQWAPDMIWYDDATSYVSPDYFVQEMYSNNTGDHTLISTVTGNTDKVYQSASYDTETGDIILKIVNPYDYDQNVTLGFGDRKLSGKADMKTLTAPSDAATNSIEEPERVRTYTAQLDGISDGSMVNIPAYSFVVIRVHQ